MPPRPEDAVLAAAADRFGTPAHVHLTDAIETRIAELRAAFGRWFAPSHAMKWNPNPGLLAWLAPRVDHIDVSSPGEFRLAVDAG
jgi:diaminopimelate decarboxylase